MAEEKKVKVEGGGDGAKQKRRTSHHSNSKKTSRFEAPTEGLKKEIFECGKPEHAASFEKTLDALANWVAINFKKGGPEAGKALKDQIAPTYVLPGKPEAGISEWDLMILQKEWAETREAMKVWEENNKKLYALLLSHSTPEMRE